MRSIERSGSVLRWSAGFFLFAAASATGCGERLVLGTEIVASDDAGATGATSHTGASSVNVDTTSFGVSSVAPDAGGGEDAGEPSESTEDEHETNDDHEDTDEHEESGDLEVSDEENEIEPAAELEHEGQTVEHEASEDDEESSVSEEDEVETEEPELDAESTDATL